MRPVVVVALAAFAPFALTACAGAMHMDSPAPLAQGTLAKADGTALGSVTITDGPAGALHVDVQVHDFAPGVYGAHLHAAGRCDGPAFATAGGHWNPTMHKHGRLNPDGAHAGDLPNLQVDASGRGAIAFDTMGTIDTLLDADGAALIVHAHADDERTDPSGNSGDRMACAVLVPMRAR